MNKKYCTRSENLTPYTSEHSVIFEESNVYFFDFLHRRQHAKKYISKSNGRNVCRGKQLGENLPTFKRKSTFLNSSRIVLIKHHFGTGTLRFNKNKPDYGKKRMLYVATRIVPPPPCILGTARAFSQCLFIFGFRSMIRPPATGVVLSF